MRLPRRRDREGCFAPWSMDITSTVAGRLQSFGIRATPGHNYAKKYSFRAFAFARRWLQRMIGAVIPAKLCRLCSSLLRAQRRAARIPSDATACDGFSRKRTLVTPTVKPADPIGSKRALGGQSAARRVPARPKKCSPRGTRLMRRFPSAYPIRLSASTPGWFRKFAGAEQLFCRLTSSAAIFGKVRASSPRSTARKSGQGQAVASGYPENRGLPQLCL
jgi:hypothetical protein